MAPYGEREVLMYIQQESEKLNELALFAGAGGGILGGHLLRWRTVCAVEWNPYAASVLAIRQNEGHLPPFPIWDDVQTFDGHPWRGRVDVVSGGFPCQDISVSGKGAGIDGAKSGMWKHMARIVGEVRPRFVFVENSPAILTRGIGRVLEDISALGYDAKWGIVSAENAGAIHKRERFWIVGKRRGLLPDTDSAHGSGFRIAKRGQTKRAVTSVSVWWKTEPALGRVANGVANRVDRLKAIGNGQVSGVAALAWRILSSL
jgi:DNA (cytosine-5)-methyltransferase 1